MLAGGLASQRTEARNSLCRDFAVAAMAAAAVPAAQLQALSSAASIVKLATVRDALQFHTLLEEADDDSKDSKAAAHPIKRRVTNPAGFNNFFKSVQCWFQLMRLTLP